MYFTQLQLLRPARSNSPFTHKPATSLCTQLLEVRLAKATTVRPPCNRPPKGRPVGLTSDRTAAPPAAVGCPTGSSGRPHRQQWEAPPAAVGGPTWTPPAESFTWGAFALASGLVVAGAGAYEGVSGRERNVQRVYSGGLAIYLSLPYGH